MSGPLLSTESLVKRFGGLAATDGLSLSVAEGELHALIGPNGAGKTTLIGQLSGELTPDSGTILFDGRDVTRLPVHRRAQRGLARSFQITSIFPSFTALDNVALAVQAHAGHSFRFWRDAGRDRRLADPARAVLERVGLGARADTRADALAHGEKRQLELAMALATGPRLLLLDEPMAGMGHEDIDRIAALIKRVSANRTILMVEHNLSVVANLSDWITVLARGEVLAEGPYAEVSRHPKVREAYMGSGHA